MDINVITYGSEKYKMALEFRNTVMRAPLGLSIYDEKLSGEIYDTILCGYDNDIIIATTIITPYKEKGAKLRQVAVLKDYRGKGYGREIMLAAMEKAKELGFLWVTLNSRLNAINFYKRLGFCEYGNEFEEVGLPHIKMKKIL